MPMLPSGGVSISRSSRQPGHLRRKGSAANGVPRNAGEDQEVQSHADGEVEAPHEVQYLARRILSAKDSSARSAFCMWAMTRVAVLNIRLLHRDAQDLRVYRSTMKSAASASSARALVGADIGGRRAGLSDGKANEMFVELDALRLEDVDSQLLRSSKNAGLAVRWIYKTQPNQ